MTKTRMSGVGAQAGSSVAEPSRNGGGREKGSAGNDAAGKKQALKVASPAKQPATVDESAVGRGNAQTEQPSPYTLRDLSAQEDMAYWSMLMAFAALATLIVTSLGTFLIWRQVKLTREAVDDTGKATIAMVRANEIASDTAKRQLRAYLDFDGVHLERWPINDVPNSGYVAVLAKTNIRNYGHTPAEEMTINTINFISMDGERVQFTVEDRIDFDSVAPTDCSIHRAYWQIPEKVWAALEQKSISIVISIIATYRDAFGDNHVLRSDFQCLNVSEELGFVGGTRKAT